MNDKELDELLAASGSVSDDRVVNFDLRGLDAEMREEIMSSSPQNIHHLPRRKQRKSYLLAAAASVAVLVGVSAILPNVINGSDKKHDVVAESDLKWTAASVSFAEVSPRLLVSASGWSVKDANQTATDEAELAFANGAKSISVNWRPIEDYDAYVKEHSTGVIELQSATILGHVAKLFQDSADNKYFTAIWRDDSHTIEASGNFASEQDYRDVLNSLANVSVDAWLSSMPTNVVKPGERAGAVQTMTQGIPVPQGFDMAALGSGDTLKNRYQLGAEVTSSISCAWIGQLFEAKASGNASQVNAATQALGTAHNWAVLKEMETSGAYPSVLWGITDEIANNGKFVGKTGAENEQVANYKGALGCK